MVKIRYAGSGVVLSSRALIEQAITNTSAKFDNNIVANRFEQTTTTTYEVTIKCVSSRGKGAKRGASGRRTQSCCWHAHGVFFEELFRLNPEIVIVANGSRITSQSHVGWRDNDPEPMCDCEREHHPEPVVTAPTVRHCDASCRHNSANHNGVTCTRACGTRLLHWEPCVTPTVNRSCATCRYSMNNTISHTSQCPPGECLNRSGLQLWEQHIPTTPAEPIVEVRCSDCMHGIEHNGRNEYCTEVGCYSMSHFEPYVTTPTPRCFDCAYSRERRATVECPYNNHELCLVDNEHNNFVRWVDDPTPSNQRCCCDCKYAAGNNNNERCNCSMRCLIGDEHRWFVKFVARTTTPKVTKCCATCKYGTTYCHPIVGNCDSSYNKWQPLNDTEGFNPELYMQQPTVMPEEKGYMDFEGVMWG